MTMPKYPHDPALNRKYKDWVRFTCQCRYRNEACDLTWEQYQAVWGDQYHLRGRTSLGLVLTRKDPASAWTLDNVEIISRVDHLRNKNYRATVHRREHGLGYKRKHNV